MRLVSSTLSGVLFGIGLWLSGMTDPAKVIAFLDVTGQWNPALAFVMLGAIGVFAPIYWWTRLTHRQKPFAEASFHPPAAHLRVDGRLIAGSALFGVGWGIAGICPGPAVVNAASGAPVYLAFTFAMAVTLLALRRVSLHQGAAKPAVRSSAQVSQPLSTII